MTPHPSFIIGNILFFNESTTTAGHDCSWPDQRGSRSAMSSG